MKNQRLKQFAASFLIVLSLFASSISAACSCSHEMKDGEHCQNSVETKNEPHAAHRYLHETQNASAHCHDNKTDSAKIASISEGECCCLAQPAPRAVAKTENVKIEKQQAAILSATKIEFVLIHQIVSIETARFAAPFYLSDSFHNLTPGRAPPRL